MRTREASPTLEEGKGMHIEVEDGLGDDFD